jgi:hypothetical protein
VCMINVAGKRWGTHPGHAALDHVWDASRESRVTRRERPRLAPANTQVVHKLKQPGRIALLVGAEDQALGLGEGRHVVL